MKNSTTDDVALLILSYDKAAPLWHGLEKSYEEFWRDNPLESSIVSNTGRGIHLTYFRHLVVGNETSWSDSVRKALHLVSQNYVLISYDDLYLCKKVDTNFFVDRLKMIVSCKLPYYRFHPSPGPDVKLNDYEGIIYPDSMYRTSTVFTVFRKDILLALLNDDESAWQFERYASSRSFELGDFYVGRSLIFDYKNLLVKGKWVPWELSYYLKRGYPLDPSEFTKMTFRESIVERAKRLRLKLFLLIFRGKSRSYIFILRDTFR
jgi:hypothetical protein